MRKRKIGRYFIFASMFLSLGANNVLALTQPRFVGEVKTSNANIVIEGKNVVSQGEEFSLNIKVSNIEGSNLRGIQGVLEVADYGCISFKSLESSNNVNYFNNKFAYSDFDGFKEDIVLLTASFKANSNSCRTDISINDIKMAFIDRTKIEFLDNANTTIEVVEPKKEEITNLVEEEKNNVVPILLNNTKEQEKQEVKEIKTVVKTNNSKVKKDESMNKNNKMSKFSQNIKMAIELLKELLNK